MNRKTIRIVIIAALALLALGTPALAQITASLDPARPTLRHHVTVTGDVVRIGDLIENAGSVAHVPVFRAPDLGDTGAVSAERVVEAVRKHTIVALNPHDGSEVVVTRASRAFTSKTIEERIARVLTTEHSLGDADAIAIRFDRELRTLHIDPAVKGEPRLARIYFDRRSGRFDVNVNLPGDEDRKSLRLTGTATPTVAVVTLVRPLSRGEVLKRADVVSERRPRAEVTGVAVASADLAIGLAARRSLNPGRPLLNTDLMKPELVQRDSSVTLFFEVPGIVLTVRGKALEAGAEGDVISVLNVQSKRTVQGTVSGPGRVIVTSTTTHVAAAVDQAASSIPDNARKGAE